VEVKATFKLFIRRRLLWFRFNCSADTPVLAIGLFSGFL